MGSWRPYFTIVVVLFALLIAYGLHADLRPEKAHSQEQSNRISNKKTSDPAPSAEKSTTDNKDAPAPIAGVTHIPSVRLQNKSCENAEDNRNETERISWELPNSPYVDGALLIIGLVLVGLFIKQRKWADDRGLYYIGLATFFALILYTIFTRQLVGITSDAASEQARLTRQSNCINRQAFIEQAKLMAQQLDEMEADQRAWVKAEIEPASDLTLDKQDKNRNRTVRIAIRYKALNIGHSPALNVKTRVKIVPYKIVGLGIPIFADNIDEQLKGNCEAAAAEQPRGRFGIGEAWNGVLFPNDPRSIEERASFTISWDDNFSTDPPTGDAFMRNSQPPILQTHYRVLTCIDYELSAGRGVHHQTAESFELVQRDMPNVPLVGVLQIAPYVDAIPQRLLVLVRPPDWREYAN